MRGFMTRATWVILASGAGYLLARRFYDGGEAPLFGAIIGCGLGILAVGAERLLCRYRPQAMIGAVMGLTLGLFLGKFLGETLALYIPLGTGGNAIWVLGTMGFMGSLGWSVGFGQGLQWAHGKRKWTRAGAAPSHFGPYLLMDTSVIIDGRIADVCASGFLTGPLAIPRFVLRELQKIADSQDPVKRARGRRGLDVIRTLREQVGIEVRILDDEPSAGGDVDSRLVQLAKERGCGLLTNDVNMHKVAEVQGVRVLNINQLAHALKPIVLPGEELKVRIIKEGREEGQGVGYMEDGTMVVVDNGRRFLGRTVDAIVTSVIQTSAGRMIFTSVKEDQDFQAQNVRG
jgi:uncharacterized protein YacL